MKVLMIDQIAKVNYKYTFSLSNALKSNGVDIDLIIDLKDETENSICNRIKLFNTDEKNIGKYKKLINYISSYMKIVNIIKKGKYDILHAQWFIFSPIDYYFLNIIKKKYGIKLIITVHDILPFNQKFYDLRFHKKIYELADHIIVQAENNIKRFRELFENLSYKVIMIPHGHFLEYADVLDKNSARKHLNIDSNGLVMLFFGQIKKVKGVNILLEAFVEINKKYPNLKLILAGNPWKDDFSQYQKIIDDNNLGSVIRTDIRYIKDEEIKYYYSASDICILPYLDVYQSGVIQLAYAYRKPVVATNIGAFKETVIDGKTGFLCEPGSINSLVNAIENAIKKMENLELMGEAGYKYVDKKYSWNSIAYKIINLYKS